ncbi:MAG: DUF1080 domain-containing protein [Acidobacteria bacterium]|nr:DUF1080 domain-containing protein [Acidobacteriota bacterium]
MLKRIMPVFLALLFISTGFAKSNPYVGKWDITATTLDSHQVCWLEVKETNGQLSGSFLYRWGSVYPLTKVSLENNELVFDASQPGMTQIHKAKLVGGKLIGTLTLTDKKTNKTETINWVGVRAPRWGKADANAKHTYGKPVDLFDGKSIESTWGVEMKGKPSGWSVVNGVMENQAGANNLVSKQTFQNFKIHAEYKLEAQSNSGIYLRGRYELQVLDDYGKAPESHGHMAIYSRVAPQVNASKPAGEWQEMEAIIVGNRVTVFLNGQKVHDNQIIDGVTGGALDSAESKPGPIMLQGDHGRVWFRKVTVTPIIK